MLYEQTNTLEPTTTGTVVLVPPGTDDGDTLRTAASLPPTQGRFRFASEKPLQENEETGV